MACQCITPFGDGAATRAALLEKRSALVARPVLGTAGGDEVPLALLPGRELDESLPPSWLEPLKALALEIPGEGWGSARKPVIVTSSNFGVGSLLAFRQHGDDRNLGYGVPFRAVDRLVEYLGWGSNVTIFSHACVSANVGLLHGSRMVWAGMADEVLVFSFDFLSPFVTGGFHSLKILNRWFPAPYQDREVGAIGLGDGAGFAVLGTPEGRAFTIEGQSVFNELHHFTANRGDGSGFTACLEPVAKIADGCRVWLRGHGTGTLEAGRLEANAFAAAFPDAPLVGWKGSLGHTLGSCGIVELAIACEAVRAGTAPGTVGSASPTFTDTVAIDSLDVRGFDGVVCASNAFGGAHAALLLRHD